MKFGTLKNRTSAFALLTYLLYALYIFYPSISSTGIINGEDAGNPITPSQVMVALELGSSTLSYGNVLTYKNFISGAALPFQIVNVIFSKAGLTTQFPAIVFILTYTMAAYGIFFLARHLECNVAASYFAGGIYISSPIFFNYTIFGWNYVLITMAIMPYATFFFIKSLECGRLVDAIKSGILFFFATMQSQSIVWFPMIYIALALSIRSQPWVTNLRLTAITIAVGFLLNLHVILPALLFPDPALQGTSYVFSGASLGTTAHFYPLNTIRLFGSLFNYQYESLYQSTAGHLITFIIPGIAMCGLLANVVEARRPYINAMLLIFCIPLFIWILSFNREVLLHIPFSNIFRDLARFSVLPAFGLSLLVAFGVTGLSLVRNRALRYGVYTTAFTTFCICAFPFVNGELYYDSPRVLFDSRVSHLALDQSYLEVENFLAKDDDDFKVVYLPISFNATVKSLKAPQFKDGVRDIFAIYSPKPGLFSFDDRGRGDQSEFSLLTASLQSDLNLFSHSNVKYFIFRDDLESYNVEAIGGSVGDRAVYRALSNHAVAVFKSGDVTVFKNMSWERKISVVNQNSNQSHVATEVPLVFVKVDPTLYLVKLQIRPGDVTLRFLESWSKLWRLTIVSEKYITGLRTNSLESMPTAQYFAEWFLRSSLQVKLLSAATFDDVKHLQPDIGSNSWAFSTQDLCSVSPTACSIEEDGHVTVFLAIEYEPQKYFLILLAISISLFCGFFGFIMLSKRL